MKYWIIVHKKTKKLPIIKGDSEAGLYGTKKAAESWLCDSYERKNWIAIPVEVNMITRRSFK